MRHYVLLLLSYAVLPVDIATNPLLSGNNRLRHSFQSAINISSTEPFGELVRRPRAFSKPAKVSNPPFGLY